MRRKRPSRRARGVPMPEREALHHLWRRGISQIDMFAPMRVSSNKAKLAGHDSSGAIPHGHRSPPSDRRGSAHPGQRVPSHRAAARQYARRSRAIARTLRCRAAHEDLRPAAARAGRAPSAHAGKRTAPTRRPATTCRNPSRRTAGSPRHRLPSATAPGSSACLSRSRALRGCPHLRCRPADTSGRPSSTAPRGACRRAGAPRGRPSVPGALRRSSPCSRCSRAAPRPPRPCRRA